MIVGLISSSTGILFSKSLPEPVLKNMLVTFPVENLGYCE